MGAGGDGNANALSPEPRNSTAPAPACSRKPAPPSSLSRLVGPEAQENPARSESVPSDLASQSG